MSNQEILEKAIQKAIDGGWKPRGLDGEQYKSFELPGSPMNENNYSLLIRFGGFGGEVMAYEELIFDHDFAKALWPENLCQCGAPYNSTHDAVSGGKVTVHRYVDDWKHHLSHMVIADDPILYLGEHIND